MKIKPIENIKEFYKKENDYFMGIVTNVKRIDEKNIIYYQLLNKVVNNLVTKDIMKGNFVDIIL